jgi:hypothetical protein
VNVADVRKLKHPLDRLLYFIRERESVRRKKELGLPRPWTDDEILDTYRFCNVRRMDDRVSRWLLSSFYVKNHPNVVAAAALARHFNLPSCLEHLRPLVFRDGPPDWNAVKSTARRLKTEGWTIFNGAYMVRGIGTSDKTEMVVDRVCRPLHENPPVIDGSSMESAVAVLLPYWGFSTFMAGQVAADLRWVVTGRWADRNTWAPVGPGSARGLARLLYGDDWVSAARGYVARPEDWLFDFRPLVKTLRERLPTELTKRLEAMDFQNVCCEFDKYTRALTGEGRPKQLYRGAAA